MAFALASEEHYRPVLGREDRRDRSAFPAQVDGLLRVSLAHPRFLDVVHERGRGGVDVFADLSVPSELVGRHVFPLRLVPAHHEFIERFILHVPEEERVLIAETHSFVLFIVAHIGFLRGVRHAVDRHSRRFYAKLLPEVGLDAFLKGLACEFRMIFDGLVPVVLGNRRGFFIFVVMLLFGILILVPHIDEILQRHASIRPVSVVTGKA